MGLESIIMGYDITFIEDKSHRHKEEYLYLFEPYSINYYNYNTVYWNCYKGVITWNRKIFEGNRRMVNMILLDPYPEIEKVMLDNYPTYKEKENAICYEC